MRYSFAVILFFVAAESVLAPDSEGLHKLYGDSTLVSRNRDGNPDSENFHLRGDIRLTVIYGPDHHACLVKLEPERPLLPERPYHEMSSERVSEILEEIAPYPKRGKLLMGRIDCAGSVGVRTDDYEYLLISRHLNKCEENSESNATMNFKRDACPEP